MTDNSKVVQLFEYQARYFGGYNCKRINFRLEDNGDSYFYEAKVRGTYSTE